MDSLKNLLSRRIRQSGLAKQVGTALIIEYFQKIASQELGDQAGKRIKPLYLKNNILTVACVSSVLAQELNLKKQLLLAELQKKFGPEAVKDIRLVI